MKNKYVIRDLFHRKEKKNRKQRYISQKVKLTVNSGLSCR